VDDNTKNLISACILLNSIQSTHEEVCKTGSGVYVQAGAMNEAVNEVCAAVKSLVSDNELELGREFYLREANKKIKELE